MTTTAALCATLIYEVGDLWFSTDSRDRARAKTICRRCPIRPACAQAGLDAGDTARGVWGGLSSGDRRVHRTGRLDGPDPDDEGEQARVPVLRERRPCGDYAAYMAHRRYGETCDVCEAAHGAWVDQRRRALLDKHHTAGGTAAGARLHRRFGERPCDACLAASRADKAASRARVAQARQAHSALRSVPAGVDTPGAHAGAHRGVGAAA